jgi:hypothetical protein
MQQSKLQIPAERLFYKVAGAGQKLAQHFGLFRSLQIDLSTRSRSSDHATEDRE